MTPALPEPRRPAPCWALIPGPEPQWGQRAEALWGGLSLSRSRSGRDCGCEGCCWWPWWLELGGLAPRPGSWWPGLPSSLQAGGSQGSCSPRGRRQLPPCLSTAAPPEMASSSLPLVNRVCSAVSHGA